MENGDLLDLANSLKSDARACNGLTLTPAKKHRAVAYLVHSQYIVPLTAALKLHRSTSK